MAHKKQSQYKRKKISTGNRLPPIPPGQPDDPFLFPGSSGPKSTHGMPDFNGWSSLDEDLAMRPIEQLSSEELRANRATLVEVRDELIQPAKKRDAIGRSAARDLKQSNLLIRRIDLALIRRRENRSQSSEFTPSEDYRSVVFKNRQYTLTRNQSAVVRVLDQARMAGHPDVAESKLLESIGARTSRVRDSFRKSLIWRTLIIQGARKGTYRLNLPL